MHGRSGHRMRTRVCKTRGTGSHAHGLPGRWRFRPKRRRRGRSEPYKGLRVARSTAWKKCQSKVTLLGKGIFSENKGSLAEYFSFLWKRGNRPTQADSWLFPDSPERGLQGRQSRRRRPNVPSFAFASSLRRKCACVSVSGCRGEVGETAFKPFAGRVTALCMFGVMITWAQKTNCKEAVILSRVFFFSPMSPDIRPSGLCMHKCYIHFESNLAK